MNFEYSYSAGGDLGSFLTAYLVVWLLLFGLGIVSYILSSLGMYTIARRRELNNPWMAWVPLLRLWLQGSISDQYQYVTQGKIRNKRKWLVGLEIANLASVIIAYVMMIVLSVQIVADSAAGVPEHEQIGAVMTMLLVIMLLGLLNMGVAIAVAVIRYIALYDLFKSCVPQNAVLFLVLSILFGVPEAFFIFFSRNKDGGMPPRRPQPNSYTPQQPGYQPQAPVYQPEAPVYKPQEPADQAESSVCLSQEPADQSEPSVCLPQEPADQSEPSVCLPQEPACQPELPVVRLEPMTVEDPVEAVEPAIPMAEPAEPEAPSEEAF